MGIETHACPTCSKTFDDYTSKNRVYCSISCNGKTKMSTKSSSGKLKQMQSLPLSAKVEVAKRRKVLIDYNE